MISPARRRASILALVAILLAVRYLGHPLGAMSHRAAAPEPAPAASRLQRGRTSLTGCDLAAAEVAAPAVAAYCGEVTVPEDRAQPNGRQIRLAVAVVPAQLPGNAADAVTFLDGGPGGAARSDYPLLAPAFERMGRRRDILLVDQRGTGASNAFACSRSGAASGDGAARIRRCLAEVQTHADPRFYTTSDAVADLDAVRDALGYQQLSLVGVSYGTRVAQQYAGRYPEHVRAIVLDSPVPNRLLLGSEHAANLDAVLNARFQACQREPACAQRFGSPERTLHELLDRLEHSPVDVVVPDPLTAAARPVHLTRDELALVVRLYAYHPLTLALLPFTLEEARLGHYAALTGQALEVEGDLTLRLDSALEFSVLCSEDIPGLTPDPADAGTVLGEGFVRRALAICALWPHGAAPADFHAPLQGALPTLLLSGEFDPVTPPRYADEIARHLSLARVLRVPGQGHAVMGTGCMPHLLGEFIDKPTPAALDATCLARERAADFFLGYTGPAP